MSIFLYKDDRVDGVSECFLFILFKKEW